MQTALVHEWLTNVAGSEKVLAALRRIWVDAPIYTSMCWSPAFPDWDNVRTTFLQRFASGPSAHIPALPLMPLAFSTLKPDADLVITSFHSFALWARTPVATPHLVYCHTPPRYLWAPQNLEKERVPGRRVALQATGAVLRPADRRRARSATRFVANSSSVAQRIRDVYGIDAEVVHPPVDVDRFASQLSRSKADYFLVLSRLVPYKRVDLAITAFAELRWPVVVAGSGRAEQALRRSAPPWVRFTGRVPDEELPTLMAEARGLVMPAEEDFGITAVEAMAAGTPVITVARGGAKDTVVDGLTGVLYEPTASGLTRAIRQAAAQPWDRSKISAHARQFDEEHFRANLLEVVASMTN